MFEEMILGASSTKFSAGFGDVSAGDIVALHFPANFFVLKVPKLIMLLPGLS